MTVRTRSPSFIFSRRVSTSDGATSAKVASSDTTVDEPIPLLQRPLGVPQPPTTATKTWTEKRNDLLNKDIIMAQRTHLLKEASKGYFQDLNATRRHGGKTWIAPTVMIREDKALYFPNIVGKTLADGARVHTTDMCAGRISVISMLSTKISEYHSKGYVVPTNNRFTSHPFYQFIQINLQENLLKAALVSLFASSLRSSIPESLWSKYLVSRQNMEYTREPLGMVNSRVGYVYLVDEDLKVRWGACADPKEEEMKALENCTGVLLNRLDKKMGRAREPLTARPG